MYRPVIDYSSTSSNHQFPSEYRQNNNVYGNSAPSEFRMRSQSADSRRAGFFAPVEPDFMAPDPPPRQVGGYSASSSGVSFPSSSFRRFPDGGQDELDMMGAHLPAATGYAQPPAQQQAQFNNHAPNFTQQLRERSPTSSSALLNLLQRYPSARQSVFHEPVLPNHSQANSGGAPRIIRSDGNHRQLDTHVYRPPDANSHYPLVEVAAYRSNGPSTESVYLNNYPANSIPTGYAYSPGNPGTLPHNFRFAPESNATGRIPSNTAENSNYSVFSNNNNNINNNSANNSTPDFQEFAQLNSLLDAVIGGENDMSKTTSEWRNSFAQMQERFKNRVADAHDNIYHPGFTSSGAPTLPRRGGQLLVKSSSHHAFPEHSMLGNAVERRAAEAPEVRRSGAIDSFWNNSVAKQPTSPPIQRIPTSLTAAERLQMLQEPADGRPATPVIPQRTGSGPALAARREYYLSEASTPVPQQSERDRLTPSFTRTFAGSPNFSELDNAVSEMNSEVRRTGYSLGARRLGGCGRFPTDEAAFSPPRTLAPIPHRGLHSASPTDSVSETSSVYQIPTGLPHPRPKHNLKEQLHQAGIQSTYFNRTSPRPGPNFPVPSTGSVASRITEFERRPGTPTLQISTAFANERMGGHSSGPMSPRSTVFRSKPVIHVDMGTHHARTPHVASTHFDFPLTRQVFNDDTLGLTAPAATGELSPLSKEYKESSFITAPVKQIEKNGRSIQDSLLHDLGKISINENRNAHPIANGHVKNHNHHLSTDENRLNGASTPTSDRTANHSDFSPVNQYGAKKAQNGVHPDQYIHDSYGYTPSAGYGSQTLGRTPLAPLRVQPKVNVPQFYFPQGKPVTQSENNIARSRVLDVFRQLPDQRCQISDMPAICRAAGLPVYLKAPVLNMMTQGEDRAATSLDFTAFWTNMTSVAHDMVSRFMHILSAGRSNSVTRADLVPMVMDIIHTHPGLAFYRNAVEFHDKYCDVVITRIFWNLQKAFSDRLTREDIRKSDLIDRIFQLEKDDDINKSLRYFSYEHFYVVYCCFWEIDSDHNMLVNRADMERYNDGAIPSEVIESIFSPAVCGYFGKGKERRQYIGIREFTHFLLADEDKTHPMSQIYWMRALDKDGMNFLTMQRMEILHAYVQDKMTAEGIDSMQFKDVLCNIIDAVVPVDSTRFRISDLRRNPKMAPNFFNALVNWRKFYQQESTEGSEPAVESSDGEELTPWDKFCAERYESLIDDSSEAGDGNIETYDLSLDDDDEGYPSAQFHDLL